MPEHPHQIRALFEIQPNVSGADRGIHLENALGEFFNPHDLPYLGNMALLRRAIIAPEAGQREENLFSNLGLTRITDS